MWSAYLEQHVGHHYPLTVRLIFGEFLVTLDHVPIGDLSPQIVNMIVEIPQGSSNKYEYDHDLGVFKLDRTLYSPLFYPFDYGWVCDTLADDGDPLDILVITSQPTFPGCLIAARPLGVLMMRDDKGPDEKILSVAAADPRFEGIDRLSDLPGHILKEIVHFFDIYKELEEKETNVLGWQDVATAYSVIQKFTVGQSDAVPS